jgi:hypothetical protein
MNLRVPQNSGKFSRSCKIGDFSRRAAPWMLVSVDYWNSTKIVRSYFEKLDFLSVIFGPSEGPFSLELECSDSQASDLWPVNSAMPNMNNTRLTVQLLTGRKSIHISVY